MLAFVAISTILLLVFRNMHDTLLVLATLALSALLTSLFAQIAGLSINYANIIALPLLLGVGVSFNVYFVMNFRAGMKHFLSSATAQAVLFSALTTGTAFGTLAASHDRGTSSMGDSAPAQPAGRADRNLRLPADAALYAGEYSESRIPQGCSKNVALASPAIAPASPWNRISGPRSSPWPADEGISLAALVTRIDTRPDAGTTSGVRASGLCFEGKSYRPGLLPCDPPRAGLREARRKSTGALGPTARTPINYPRNTPPVFLPTSATIFAEIASSSASEKLFSTG